MGRELEERSNVPQNGLHSIISLQKLVVAYENLFSTTDRAKL
jgi:hypothetical protein